MLDANVLLSYAISRDDPAHTIVGVVDAALAGTYRLVLPAELIAEITRVASTKPYYQDRLDTQRLKEYMDDLEVIAELLEPLAMDLERIVRDPNDDYLIAASLFHDVDLLVSGDKDLLVLAAHLDRPGIMSPRDFLDLIAG